MSTILFYINAINGGGAERVMVQLSSLFANAGFRVVLVTSFRDKTFEYPLPPLVERISIENEEIKQNIFARNYTRIMALRRICKQVKPDVVISFMCEPNFRALIATIGLRIKKIVSVRNDPNKEYGGLLGWIVGKLLMPLADGCVFQTEDAKKWFSSNLQNKSIIIPNPVKNDFYDAIHKPVLQRIVSCGRLSKQKNQKILLESFANVSKKYQRAELFIYGEGSIKSELEDKIKALGLTGRVYLQGQTDNVVAALSEADIFVMSSDYEGMPNALMEALAVGVPCISTDCPCGGPKMLIKNGYDGLLVPIRDVGSLTNAIDKLLSDPELKHIMGKRARQSASRFRSDVVFIQWRNYIRSIVEL